MYLWFVRLESPGSLHMNQLKGRYTVRILTTLSSSPWIPDAEVDATTFH